MYYNSKEIAGTNWYKYLEDFGHIYLRATPKTNFSLREVLI